MMGPKPTDNEKKHCPTAAYQVFGKFSGKSFESSEQDIIIK